MPFSIAAVGVGVWALLILLLAVSINGRLGRIVRELDTRNHASFSYDVPE